jgi:hypothetical protein
MGIPLRKSWFRTTIVAVALLSLTAAYPFTDHAVLREGSAKALQGSTLLFAICTALSLALLNNYVKGLTDTALKRVTDARVIVEKLYDEFHQSEDEDAKQIVKNYLLPLLSFSTTQWLAFDPLKPVLERIVEPLTRLQRRNPAVVPRYFLRLEDEINQLGLLYIRRVVSGFHSDTIEGSFLLVSVGILGLFTVALLPHGFLQDYIAVASAIAIAMFAVLELFLLVSYIRQESKEELPSYNDDN